MTGSARAYRDSATQGATHIDILLACYDALAQDIRLAGESAARGDVVARCRYSQHALLFIGHLESWISLLDNLELCASLTDFYTYVRAEILRLQVCTELGSFMKLALLVCETRAAWQSKQSAELSKVNVVSTATTYSLAEPETTFSHFTVSA